MPPLSTAVDSALTVAGLTDYIRALLEDDAQLHQVWVIGEVSSARQHRQGCFFTLQEPDGSAAISCVVWRSQLARLAALPAVGEQVIVLGQIRLYPKRGSYQLTVWQVLPAGAGLQALRYRQLRSRLAAEGLFDAAQKRPLPAYPQTVAVVTSPQAAAWGDIQRTLGRRSPGLLVLLSPAIVQGEQAPGSIVKAIQRVQQDGRAAVLLLARGGGASEDLACFDNERVVRAIATCPIPVVTGIGHERDQSLADLTADLCAHTPTAAAEQAVPNLDQLYQEQADLLQQTVQLTAQRLYQAAGQLQTCRNRLRQVQLDRQLDQAQQTVHQCQQRLLYSLGQRLQMAQHRHQLIAEKLVALDPTAVLQRGYALVRQNHQIVTRAAALAPGDPIEIQLAAGQLRATVTEILTED